MRHPVRGFLIGPIVAPIAYWIGVMAYAWFSDFRMDGFRVWRELMVIVGFGLPIAYAAAFVWGAPVLYALHRLGWLRASTAIVAGALGGTLVAVLLALGQQDSVIRIRMPLAAGAVIGALAAAACWWAGQGKTGPHAPAA